MPTTKFTPGPWDIWDGWEYVGGGRDLCIGAGDDWLVNMDHRECVNKDQHMCGGNFYPCKQEPNTYVCSTSGCRCNDDPCPYEGEISEEQIANAVLISKAPEMYALLKEVVAHGHATGRKLSCFDEIERIFYQIENPKIPDRPAKSQRCPGDEPEEPDEQK